MLNNCNMSNRRMIMSAEMLDAYQQDAKESGKNSEQVTQRNQQKSDALYEHDDNPIYELGYN
ncbi:hypothetical protein [Colwellia psychrerythraea]|uniref:Uncharacterized protein n=1 Tax=Colwellia psychrerythraea TaxID=28229 RepID=A0A099KGV3_COLPS|nr:hypothetical protein [Colwellia psychrerythraea]KGJ90019.1 hypothetical protein ND2E_3575 [Colwellia psychrerythraea]